MDQKPSLDMSNQKHWNFFIITSVVSFFCALINARVFHIVYIKSSLKARPANILVAHLSTVAIIQICALFIYFLEKLSLISLNITGFCNILALLTHTVYNLLSLNLVAIVWIRTRKRAVNLGKSYAFRTVGMMWTIALLGNLPTIFMVKIAKYPGTELEKCKTINLLDSVALTITYNAVRFILVNMMVCIYLLHVTIKLRSSLKYLQMQRIQNERTLRKIQQVRFVYRHSFILMIIWLPHGIAFFMYRISGMLGWSSYGLKFSLPLAFFIYAPLILCPMSYVILLEKISIAKIFLPCWWINYTSNSPFAVVTRRQSDPIAFGWRVDPIVRRRQSSIPHREKSVTWSKKTGVRIRANPNNLAQIEMSLLTTVGFTGITGSLYHSMALMTPWRLPIVIQTPPIPALLAQSTAQNIVVEVHDEPEPCNIEEDQTEFTKRNIETLI